MAGILLERERETAVLEDALAQAASGRGALVAIEGEPGIGKSALVALARELAGARGVDALHLRASETERGFGYGLVRELADGLLRGGEAGLDAQGLPELLDRALEAPPPELRVARGLSRLVGSRASQGALLVAIDDAHWADLPSLRVLLYLGRRIEPLAAVLCLTTRPPAGAERASRLLDPLLAEAGERLLRPAALGPEAAAALVSAALPGAAPEFCRACHEATGGNPLLLRELIRSLVGEGVEPAASSVSAIPRIGGRAVIRTVRLRLAHLPAAATRLAEAAAVLGDGAPIANAARIAGLDPETAFEAAARLGQLEVLAGGGRTSFVHPLVREAVLSDLALPEAAALHGAAASLLRELGAPPERVAEHLLRSAPAGSAETVRLLREAARVAAASGDPATAAELLARALEEPPAEADRPAILLELAAAERSHDARAAAAHAQTALGLIDDPAARAAATLELASLLPATDPRRAIDLLEPHVELLPDPEARLRARAVLLTGALLAPGALPRARAISRQLGPDLVASSAAARMAIALAGYLDALDNRPATDVVRTIADAIAAPLGPPYILGQLTLGLIALVAADSPLALSVADEWKGIAEETGVAALATAALMSRAHALLACGRLREAVADGREGIEVCELYVGGAPLSWTAAALLEALIETGDLDGAERVASRAASGGSPEWTLDLHGLLACRARLAALRGDRAAGLGRTLELGRLCEEAGIRNPALAPWRSRAALLLADGGEAGRARTLAEEEVELARAWGAPRALGRALSALALVRQGDEALALHAEAVDVLDGSPARLELARAALELGAALRRAGRGAAARPPLRRAAELAGECGAAPLAARARDELVAAGARPRRPELSGPHALTPQERRVAAIAAEGASNREIAERLYLAPRTVESHLSRAYRKLGITSRSQLRRALAS